MCKSLHYFSSHQKVFAFLFLWGRGRWTPGKEAGTVLSLRSWWGWEHRIWAGRWLLCVLCYCFMLRACAQSCLILWDPMDCSSLSFSVRGIFHKNTGVGCHFLLQGIFPTQGSKPHLLHLLHWQVGSLPREPPGKPVLLFANSLFDNHHLTIIP